MPKSLGKLINASHIVLDLKAKTKLEAIREVAGLLQKDEGMRNFKKFCDELIEREEQSATLLGFGVAMPHVRTDCLGEIVIAVGRSEAGIAFGEQLTRLIFVIGTPRSMIGEYLRLVSILARALKNEGTRESLLRAGTPEDFIAALGAP